MKNNKAKPKDVKRKVRHIKLQFGDYFCVADKFVGVGALLVVLTIVIFALVGDLQGVWFQIILNLSYSFLAAVIFYILQVIIPRVSDMKHASKVLSSDLVDLYVQLATAVAIFSNFFDIDDDKVKIKHLYDGFIYYDYIDGNFHSREYKNIMSYTKNFSDNIGRKIAKIRGSILFAMLPDRLVSILSDLELEKFQMICAIGDMYPNSRRYSGIFDNLCILNCYERLLGKYISDNTQIKVRELSDLGRKQYIDDLERCAPIITSFQASAENRRKIRERRSPIGG